jgi:hypothetical protein
MSSSGTIIYWDYSFQVGFENTEDFMVGVEHSGNYTYWDREQWFRDQYPGAYRFEPNTTIVHSGEQSIRLGLLHPNSDGERRIQTYHDWDPLETVQIWQEEWFYIPAGFLWKNPSTGEGFWYNLHTILSERMWNPDLVTSYQEYAVKLGAIWNQYSNKPVFCLTQGPVSVDNNDDGMDDFFSPEDQYFELGSAGVPTGRWFRIMSHVYRDLQNWDGGYAEFWIEDPVANRTVYHMENPCRTIGINPQRIGSLTPWRQGEYMAYLASGFTLYAGGLSDGMPSPCEIYVDDFFVGVRYS